MAHEIEITFNARFDRYVDYRKLIKEQFGITDSLATIREHVRLIIEFQDDHNKNYPLFRSYKEAYTYLVENLNVETLPLKDEDKQFKRGAFQNRSAAEVYITLHSTRVKEYYIHANSINLFKVAIKNKNYRFIGKFLKKYKEDRKPLRLEEAVITDFIVLCVTSNKKELLKIAFEVPGSSFYSYQWLRELLDHDLSKEESEKWIKENFHFGIGYNPCWLNITEVSTALEQFELLKILAGNTRDKIFEEIYFRSYSVLYLIIKNEYTEIVEWYVQQPFCRFGKFMDYLVGRKDVEGPGAIILTAAKIWNSKIVSILLDRFDVFKEDKGGMEELYYLMLTGALMAGPTETVRQILHRRSFPETLKTPRRYFSYLEDAVRGGEVEKVYLLFSELDFSVKEPLLQEQKITQNPLPIMEVINEDKQTILHLAASNNNARAVRGIVACQSLRTDDEDWVLRLDGHGETPFGIALKNNFFDVAELLLDSLIGNANKRVIGHQTNEEIKDKLSYFLDRIFFSIQRSLREDDEGFPVRQVSNQVVVVVNILNYAINHNIDIELKKEYFMLEKTTDRSRKTSNQGVERRETHFYGFLTDELGDTIFHHLARNRNKEVLHQFLHFIFSQPYLNEKNFINLLWKKNNNRTFLSIVMEQDLFDELLKYSQFFGYFEISPTNLQVLKDAAASAAHCKDGLEVLKKLLVRHTAETPQLKDKKSTTVSEIRVKTKSTDQSLLGYILCDLSKNQALDLDLIKTVLGFGLVLSFNEKNQLFESLELYIAQWSFANNTPQGRERCIEQIKKLKELINLLLTAGINIEIFINRMKERRIPEKNIPKEAKSIVRDLENNSLPKSLLEILLSSIKAGIFYQPQVLAAKVAKTYPQPKTNRTIYHHLLDEAYIRCQKQKDRSPQPSLNAEEIELFNQLIEAGVDVNNPMKNGDTVEVVFKKYNFKNAKLIVNELSVLSVLEEIDSNVQEPDVKSNNTAEKVDAKESNGTATEKDNLYEKISFWQNSFPDAKEIRISRGHGPDAKIEEPSPKSLGLSSKKSNVAN